MRFLPEDNMLPLTLEFGTANQYSLDLSKNVKRGNKTKVDKGGFCGLAPCGYLNDTGEKTIYPDPDRFHLVRSIWEMYITGTYSLAQICKYVDKEWGFRTVKRKKSGGTKLSVSSLHKIFTNSFYYGKTINGDNENWGNHQPMVTPREYEEVQSILRREGKNRTQNYDFSFTGSISCGECGSAITAEEKVKYACPVCRKQHSAKNPHNCNRCGHKITEAIITEGNWYIYYRCTKKQGKCTQKYMKEAILESQIMNVLQDLDIDSDFEKWAIEWLKYLNEDNAIVTEHQTKSLQKSFNQSQRRLKSLLDLRLDGDIEKSEFEAKKKELEAERDQFGSQIKELAQNSDQWIEDAEEEFTFVNGISKRLKTGTIKEKKYILSRVGSNLRLKDRQLTLEVKEPYLLIKKVKESKPTSLEPPKSLIDKGLMDDLKSSYPLRLGRRDSNPRMPGPKPGALPLGDAPASVVGDDSMPMYPPMVGHFAHSVSSSSRNPTPQD